MADESEIKLSTMGGKTFVSDKQGNRFELVGYGSMKDFDLDLDPRIDLTSPIYEQVQKLAARGRAANRRAAKKEERAAA